MAKAIELMAGDGSVLIELASEPEIVASDAIVEGTAGLADVVAKLDDVATTIVTVCASLHEKAYSALGALRPDAFELEFGVTLAGEAGVPLVTRGTAECTFKVTAKWQQRTLTSQPEG